MDRHSPGRVCIPSVGGVFMKKLKFLPAVLAAALILLRPQTALNSAQQAMRLWYASVAPAVFPFLALMPMLTGREACAAYNAAFGRIMQPVFHLPGAAAQAVLIAMLAGSPGGAVAIRRIASEAGISRSQIKRLAMCVCGISPAYLILGVGASLHGSATYGVRLALIQLAVQLVMLFASRKMEDSEDVPVPELTEIRNSGIQSAVLTTLGICGYMMLFGVLAGILSDLAGNAAGRFLLVVMDLPSGLAALPPDAVPVVTGAAIGFGGLCIAAQNMAALGNIGWTEYLRGRCLSSVLFACMTALITKKCSCGVQNVFSNISAAYAGSVLTALLLSVPPLIIISKNLILNNSNSPEKTAGKG